MSCQRRQIFLWSHVENRVCFMFQIVNYPFLSLTIPFLTYSNRKKKKKKTETETERGRGRGREREVEVERERERERERKRERVQNIK